MQPSAWGFGPQIQQEPVQREKKKTVLVSYMLVHECNVKQKCTQSQRSSLNHFPSIHIPYPEITIIVRCIFT